MRIAVVIPTVCNAARIQRCLEAISAQTRIPESVFLVAQGGTPDQKELQESFPLLQIHVLRLDGWGASRARNAGIRQALPNHDCVVLVDDDIALEPAALETVHAQFSDPNLGIVTGLVSTSESTRVQFPKNGVAVTRTNVWRVAMEGALALRSRVLRDVGLFDEGLGIGSSTPWESGEGTDLLLRAINSGERVLYEPMFRGEEFNPEPTIASPSIKARRYARGTGRVYRSRLGFLPTCALLGKSLAALLIVLPSRDKRTIRLQVLLGRAEGAFGKLLAPGVVSQNG